MNKHKQVYLTFIFGLFFVLILLEIGLRIEGSFERIPLSTRNNKKSGYYTILCLGNSHTRGIGAAYGQGYPEQLQKLFDEGTSRVRVINAGRSSQNSGELLEDLEYSIDKIKPDLIILQTGQPNFWNRNKFGKYLKREYSGMSFKKFIFFSSDVLYNSGVYRLSLLLVSKIKEKLRWVIIDKHSLPDLHSYGVNSAVAWIEQIEKRYDLDPAYKIDPARAAEVSAFLEGKLKSNPRYSYLFYRCLGELDLFQNKHKSAAERLIKSMKAIIDMDYNGSRYYLTYVYKKSGDQGVDKLIDAFEGSSIKIFGLDYYRSRYYLQHIYNNSQDIEVRLLIDNFEMALKDYWSKPAKSLFFTNDQIYSWLDSDFKEIIKIIQNKKIRLIMQNFAPTEHMTEGREANLFNSLYLPGVAAKFNLPFVDNNSIFQAILKSADSDRNDIFTKEGHCNMNGYKIMARNVFEKIQEEKVIPLNK
ncbi:MAG: hypothetical protein WC442_02415 [Candidatus Omnitrophota bacterium]